MRRSKTLQFEALESLTFMSVTAPAAPGHRAAWVEQLQQQQEARSRAPELSGTIRGTYQLQLAQDGSGALLLGGFGRVGGLGLVKMSARFEVDPTSPSEVLDMTLTNRRGSLAMQIGAEADGSASRFQVLHGTGAYAQASGSGTVGLTLVPHARTMGNSGTISLTLQDDGA